MAGRSGSIRRRGAFPVALALGALVLLLPGAPAAHAALQFCPPGEGAGQCAPPAGINSRRGLAIDYETGHLLVADRGNDRIDVFEEGGEFLFAFGWGVADGSTNALQSCTTTCFKGIAGSGAGQFDKPTRVAVDNDPASLSRHDVYVVDSGNSRVEKLSPTGEFIWAIGKEGNGEGEFAEGISDGVGPGGTLYVLDNIRLPENKGFKQRLQRFKPSGEEIAPQCTLREEENSPANHLAVESGGDLWAGEVGGHPALQKYDPACTHLLEPAEDVGPVSFALGVDEEDNLFAAQAEDRSKGGSIRTITAQKPSGEILRRFDYLPIASPQPEGLAAHSGNVFVSVGEEGIRRLNLPTPGPIVVPFSLEAIKVGSAKATLVGEVNPEGKETTVHFEYVDEAGYEEGIEAAEEEGKSRAEAEEEGHGFDQAKSTTSKPLGAEGFALSAFEDIAGCPNPASEAGEPGKCLNPETKYRWRVIATNADGAGEGTAEGPAFETRPSPEIVATWATGVGTDTALLHAEVNPLSIPATGFFEYVDDARFQESGFAEATKAPDVEGGEEPLDFGSGEAPVARSVALFPLKPGTTYHYRIVADNPLAEPQVGEERALRTFSAPQIEACPENEAFRIGAGALLPDCRAYELVSPLEKEGGDIRVKATGFGELAVLEQSSDSGDRLAYGSERAFGDALSSPWTSQYIAQRVAGEEWETHSINPPRGRPLFSPVTQADTEFRAFSADLCQSWLTTFAEPAPPMPGLADFMNLERREDQLCGEDEEMHFEALAPLEEPTGVPKEAAFVIGLVGVSKDGTHVLLSANGKLAGCGSEGRRQVYESVRGAGLRCVCIPPGKETPIAPCAAGSSAGGLADDRAILVGAISEDGERIFWSDHGGPSEGKIYLRIGGAKTVAISKEAEEAAGTSQSWFWGAAADGGAAILSSGNLGSGAKLYRVALEGEEAKTKTTPIGEGVLGVMGISKDANRVYFASNKAILGSGQNSEGGEAQAGQPNLYLREGGEGGSTRFVATLAGVDLSHIIAQDPHEESARVTPDGAHAAFASIAPLTPYDNRGAQSGEATREIYRYDANTNKLTCASCNPSGARPAGAADLPLFESSLHGARVISEDGSRLYFESADALAARDSNGQVDVYQWEEEGAGGCEAEDADFSAPSEGCIELISSGQSPQGSRFIESSPDGRDVFFATGSSLLPQDYGLIDIYDARLGGGLPTPPPKTPPCEGDACHPQIQAPEEPTPSSLRLPRPGRDERKSSQRPLPQGQESGAKERQAALRAGA